MPKTILLEIQFCIILFLITLLVCVFLSNNFYLLLFLFFMLLTPSFWCIFKKKFFHPIGFISFISLVFLTILPLVEYFWGNGDLLNQISSKTLKVHIIGFSLLFSSYIVSKNISPRFFNFFSFHTDKLIKLSMYKVYILSFLFMLISGIGFFIYLHHAGSWMYLITHLYQRVKFTRGYGIPKVMTYFLICPLYISYALILKNQVRSRIIRIIFLLCLIESFVIYLSLGSRGRFLLAILGLIYIYSTFRRVSFFKIGFLFTIGIFFSFFYKIYRENPDKLIEILFNVRNISSFLLLLIERSGFHYLIVADKIISNVPYQYEFQYGLTYIYSILNFIPRFIWPNKPSGASYTFFSKYWYYGNYNLPGYPSVDCFAESYWNFGYFGIIVITILAGILARQISFLQNDKKNLWNLILGFLLLRFFLGFILTDFCVVLTGEFPAIVGYIIFIRTCSYKRLGVPHNLDQKSTLFSLCCKFLIIHLIWCPIVRL